MRMTDEHNGLTVTLQPLRWQYQHDIGAWDDEWLSIGCQVELTDKDWSFEDPCLLMREARELGDWLRAAAEGKIKPSALKANRGRQDLPPWLSSLAFIEPVLGFSVLSHDHAYTVVRIHFRAEGTPPEPWSPDDSLVDLKIWNPRLAVLAEEWRQELDALPARAWVGSEAKSYQGEKDNKHAIIPRHPVKLHPWVWRPAKPLLETGHYRQAVHDAANNITVMTQAKLNRRNLSGKRLMQEAFTSNPRAGIARLVVDISGLSAETAEGMQSGVLSFATGCFQAIRNPAAHENMQWDDQTALEYLAALSVLARWIEEAKVEIP